MRKIYKISPSSLSDRYKKVGKRDVLVRCERCNWMRMNTGWSASLALPLASRVTKVLEVDIHDQLTEKFIPELGKGKVTETSGIVSSPGRTGRRNRRRDRRQDLIGVEPGKADT